MTGINLQTPLIKYPGFEISWAGDGPLVGSLYFASEDGRLLLVAAEGLVPQKEILAAKSRESINGVAYTEQFLAVSTRHEITILPNQASKEKRRGVIPAGAHGVSATASGLFIASLGGEGLALIKPEVIQPESNGKIHVSVIELKNDNLYFYRAVSLNTQSHSETLVCATRQGGIAAMTMPGIETRGGLFFTSTFKGLDVVDVCSLDSAPTTSAVCALGKDRTLVFYQDVLRNRNPVSMTFNSVQGTAYRVLNAKGSLILLTSSSLYLFPGLITRFLDGQPIDRLPTLVRKLPIEAVDINVSNDRWLLVITTEGCIVFDIELISKGFTTASNDESQSEEGPTQVEPEWAMQDREATFAAMQ